jgi:N6-L-threonylcarbamoyladenine synthase
LRQIVLGGGVTNNADLRAYFAAAAAARGYKLYWPTFELSLDNAAMIAGLGYQCYLRRPTGDPFDLKALTRMAFTSGPYF